MSGLPTPAPDSRAGHPWSRFRQAVTWPLAAVVLLWLIAGLQTLVDANWVQLGVFPRDPGGLTGIITAPLIHESWGHLMANTPALLGLGILALYGYPRATRLAVPLIWLLSGLGVWLFARESFHIGISGLTHGMMFFIVVIGFIRRDPLSIALALVVFLLFGGMASGILPQEPSVSFEYHLFGAISGVLSAWALSRLDPAQPRRPPDDTEDTAALPGAWPTPTEGTGSKDDAPPGGPRDDHDPAERPTDPDGGRSAAAAAGKSPERAGPHR